MTDIAPAEQTKKAELITCAACNEQHPLDKMARVEEVKPSIIQVTLVCPSCSHRTHAYFDTPGLAAQREIVRNAQSAWEEKKTLVNWERYKTARDVFKRNFDEVNRRWRRKLGIKKAKEGEASTQ